MNRESALASSAEVPLEISTRPSYEIAPAAPAVRPFRLRGLRQEVHARLLRARALESVAPEAYGFDLKAATRSYLVTSIMYHWYFRAQCYGLEALPRGPFLLVANHGSHVLSWDGANILSACLLDADPPRLVHGMAEHRLMELPVLGKIARQIGAVDGRRDSCISLLRAGAAVLTFPEGTRALSRSFRRRYELAAFGHGFAHVAIETGVPVIPVAVIGSEEEAPLLANPRWLQKLIRTPVAPLTPTLFVPLPVRYRIYFGSPMRLSGPATAERAAYGTARVRAAIEQLIKQGRALRAHVFR